MNKHVFFCRQLAKWLFQANWHYRTLLSVTIECVTELPDDCDVLINELLLRYPAKTSEQEIAGFLQSSQRLSSWFGDSTSAPTITFLNLDSPSFPEQNNKHHPRLETPGDLAHWFSLTTAELDWFACMWRYEATTPEHLQHYRYQLLEKRDGGMRLIEKPKPTLKRLQKKIYQDILSTLDTHPAAQGFCQGRSCLSHASQHVGKHYVLLFDITDCFHSIGWHKVYSVFKQMGYPKAVSTYLTAICTHSVRLKSSQLRLFSADQQERLKQRHLPQGAPSSPALTNAALGQLDIRLTGLARSLGLHYSRYADDIALSGNRHRDWRFLEPLIGSICLEEGVSLNFKKTRIKKSHQRQRVAGIVVNQKTNVDRRYFDTLKATLSNCSKHGPNTQNRNNHPHFRSHLLGQIQYVKSLNHQKGLKLERIFRDINFE